MANKSPNQWANRNGHAFRPRRDLNGTYGKAMNPGDIAELSIWLDGTETPEQIVHWKTKICADTAKDSERQYGVKLGPISFTVKKPGDERVPPVPDHVHGPDVRLLVGEAKVVYAPQYTIVPSTGFVADLAKDDLSKLRRLTRRAHAKRHPGDRLSDRHCDSIIESLGPDVAVRTLRDGNAVH